MTTKKVLQTIADGIHNPKTGHYLNLCSGTLQNGPDPVYEARPMHCGLGELYFVVTGRQPEKDGVSEEEVVEEVVSRSTISDYEISFEKKLEQAKKAIIKLDLPKDLTVDLLDQIGGFPFADEEEEEFRTIIDSIPVENDQGEDVTKDFQARAKRVAATLRKAAALLPR